MFQTDENSSVVVSPGANKSKPQIAIGLAHAAREKKRFVEAEKILSTALAEYPSNGPLWNARGVNLRSARRFSEAAWCFHHAILHARNSAGLWSNLGSLFADSKHIDAALVSHRRAIELNPGDTGIFHNYGLALAAAGRYEDAIDAFNHALALTPNSQEIHWDRGLCHLHLGDYVRGWADYDRRRFTIHMPPRKLPGQWWEGQRYDGKRLLIVNEQGMGDTIWVARYLRHVKSLGGELIMECREPVMPLIESMGVVDRIVHKGKPLPEADFHLYQCSLPGLYTPTLATVRPEPYISADPSRFAKFAAPLARANEKLRVGIVWSGSTTFAANHDRAVALQMFLESFTLPGVQLYSLQKGPPEAELSRETAASKIIDLAPLMDDFADTAAAVAQLDLVIMTDSSVAHLAGALGKPVWVLLNHMPYWLWLEDRGDSPWYSSVRLFRQKSWGSWNQVFDEAAAALLELVLSRI